MKGDSTGGKRQVAVSRRHTNSARERGPSLDTLDSLVVLSRGDVDRVFNLARHYLVNESEFCGASFFYGMLVAEIQKHND